MFTENPSMVQICTCVCLSPHLAGAIRAFISSMRCRRTICLLPGIPRAVAMVSVLKVGSSTMTAPWTPLLRRFSPNSWTGKWRAKERQLRFKMSHLRLYMYFATNSLKESMDLFVAAWYQDESTLPVGNAGYQSTQPHLSPTETHFLVPMLETMLAGDIHIAESPWRL